MRTLQQDIEANSKDRNNSLIKQPRATKLREYSFVLDICRNCEESLKTFDGFKFFAKKIQAVIYISERRVFSEL